MNELLKRLWAAQSRAERPPGGELDTVYMHGIITDETTQDEYRRYFNDDRTISVSVCSSNSPKSAATRCA